MAQADLVAEVFEAQRERLRGVAYRMLGSHADAEDVVQEAWLRLAGQDAAAIDNLAAWLTTVVGRLSVDVLRSRQRHPSAPLSDLVVTVDDGRAPEEEAALADSVGLALLVVLDSLSPSERLAFVLHDMFGVPFEEIAVILEKSTDAAKMLASRARRKVRVPSPPGAAGLPEQREVLAAFRAAALAGDFEALLTMLDPDVRLTNHAAGGTVVVLGATKVAAGARLYGNVAVRHRSVLVNGLPGFVSWQADGSPLSVMAFTVVDGRIAAMLAITDPAVLASLDLP